MEEDELQQFNLRWHNHQNSVIGALGNMYSSGTLTDVTLSAGGVTVKAHRLVLASCSQYFAQMFKEMEADTNTLVVVLSCDVTELRLLLSFIYTGEVTASKKNLPALLRLANMLKVAGLTDADCTNPSQNPRPNESECKPETDANESSSPINLETKTDQAICNTPDNNGNIFNYDSNTETDRNTAETTDNRYDERLSKLDQIVQNLYCNHKIDGPLANLLAPSSGSMDVTDVPYERKWRHGSVCTICNKRLSNQYNLRVHMETHAGARHACLACNHVSRSRDALRKHVAYRHPNFARGSSKRD